MSSKELICTVLVLLIGITLAKPTRPPISNKLLFTQSFPEENFFSKYRPYDELTTYLQSIEEMYPEVISKTTAGFSTEDRPLNLYTITNQNSPLIVCKRKKLSHVTDNDEPPGVHKRINQLSINKDYKSHNDTHNFIHLSIKDAEFGAQYDERLLLKPVIFLDAGAHSREWISPAATIYLMESLPRLDPALTNYIEWKIFPLINPDGYAYSWATNRMWRKTRSKSNTSCNGADLNRNFAFHWGEIDTATNPCLSYYGGAEPFSEPESRAIKESVESTNNPVKAYITVHNWGQEIMYPFSQSTRMVPYNEAELKQKGKRMAAAIKKSQGVSYRTGRASVRLYPSSGTVIDWAYAIRNISLAYTFELRDKGSTGFFLPSQYIRPTGEDLVAAMTSLGKDIYEEFLEANGCIT